jgi:hypothetical protein
MMSTPIPQWNSPEQYIVQSILKDSYPEFVAKLGNNINDPKFVAAIKLLSSLRKIEYKSLEVPVTKLIPTQNEIDIEKSLKYPLKDPFTAELYLNGGIVAVAGNKIITSNNGQYIIDGHHRWSQLYCINPRAMIVSYDLSDVKNPIHALEYTQLGIAGDVGMIPTATVTGGNMLTASKADIYDFIEKNIKPSVVDVFIRKGIVKVPVISFSTISPSYSPISQIQEYIWNNVQMMQMNNKPIMGAPSRSLMPQTDIAPNWNMNAPRIENYKMNYRCCR